MLVDDTDYSHVPSYRSQSLTLEEQELSAHPNDYGDEREISSANC